MYAEPSARRELATLALTLGLAVLAVQWLLSGSIEQGRRGTALRELSALTTPVEFDNDPFTSAIDLTARSRVPGLDAELIQVMPLRLEGRTVGWVVDARTRGYVDFIVVRIAFATDGHILGTAVLAHKETVGLGDRLVSENWLGRFVGSSPIAGSPSWALRRDGGEVDQLTGATLTSRAALHSLLVAATVRLEGISP